MKFLGLISKVCHWGDGDSKHCKVKPFCEASIKFSVFEEEQVSYSQSGRYDKKNQGKI